MRLRSAALVLLLGACAAPPPTGAPVVPDAAGCVPFDAIRSYAVGGPGILHLLDAAGRATHVLVFPEAAREGFGRPGAYPSVALAAPGGKVCPGDGRGIQMTVGGAHVAVASVHLHAPCAVPDPRPMPPATAGSWCLARGPAVPIS